MSELDPDKTPDGIEIGGTRPSARHINKWPLILGMGFVVTVLGLFAYSVGERSKPIIAEGGEEAAERTTDPVGPRRFLDGQPDVIPVPKEPAPEVAFEALPAPAAGATQPTVVAAPTPTSATPPPPRRKTALEQEQERQAQARLSAYYGALDAPTDVGFGGPGGDPDNPLSRALGAVATANAGQSTPTAADLAALRQAAAEAMEDPNKQLHKESFLRDEAGPKVVSGRQRVLTEFEVKTGTVIPAVMLTGLNSDLPGDIIAQVSQHVYDTATGRYVLIPQGSKLTGRYDSQVAYGQERILVVWNRLIYPDGSTVELGNMAGSDQAGYGGLADKVDNHYFRIYGSAILMSLISAGYGIAADTGNNSNDASQSAAAAVAQTLSQTTDRVLRKNLNIQPTIEVRPGYVFNVIVNKDMRFLEPFRG